MRHEARAASRLTMSVNDWAASVHEGPKIGRRRSPFAQVGAVVEGRLPSRRTSEAGGHVSGAGEGFRADLSLRTLTGPLPVARRVGK